MVTTKLGICVGVLMSLCSGSFAMSVPDDAPSGPTTKLVVVVLPLPSAGASAAVTDLPPEVAALLAENWSVVQTTSLGTASDGTHATVLLTLTQGRSRFQGPMPITRMPMLPGMTIPGMGGGGGGGGDNDANPGADTPAAPAVKQTLTLHWRDGGTSSVVIGDAVGVRSRAHVTTKDEHGAPAADYDATAFNDRQGNLIIDGRGAAMTKSEPGYSPDSMRIHADGRIDIEDDNGTHDDARLDNGLTATPGQPSAPVAPRSPSTPKGERQL